MVNTGKDSTAVSYYFQIAVGFAENNIYREAADLLMQVVELYPDNHRIIEVLNNLAYYLHRLGQYEEAEKYYLEAIQKSPSWELYNNLGRTYIRMGNFDKAVSVLSRAYAIAEDRKDVPKRNLDEARYLRGDILYRILFSITGRSGKIDRDLEESRYRRYYGVPTSVKESLKEDIVRNYKGPLEKENVKEVLEREIGVKDPGPVKDAEAVDVLLRGIKSEYSSIYLYPLYSLKISREQVRHMFNDFLKMEIEHGRRLAALIQEKGGSIPTFITPERNIPSNDRELIAELLAAEEEACEFYIKYSDFYREKDPDVAAELLSIIRDEEYHRDYLRGILEKA